MYQDTDTTPKVSKILDTFFAVYSGVWYLCFYVYYAFVVFVILYLGFRFSSLRVLCLCHIWALSRCSRLHDKTLYKFTLLYCILCYHVGYKWM